MDSRQLKTGNREPTTEVILKVENLSKQYRLGTVGTGTISHDFNRFLARIRGKEDPYLKIGETNDRASKGNSEYVWALKDINFEVKKGEVLGIIGKNGAGKSTLLKILSKVTGPTTGSIKSKGRIASLLEVGTGFHPEMTGKENIFLNGAILGMTKKEIAAKLDEIVAFSGCERYIDTPVKRYSSGMTVRLAFAVAAHLEPDILIIDEVLAVGDVEFQKKAIGKMKDISGKNGRTVLFVSHNMTAVANLCSKVIVLKDGAIKFIGITEDAVENYLKNQKDNNHLYQDKLIEDDEFKLINFDLINENGESNYNFYTNQEISFEFNFLLKKTLNGLRIGFDLIDNNNSEVVFRSFNDDLMEQECYMKGSYNLNASIPKNLLKPGNYLISVAIGIHNVRWISLGEINIPITIFNINGINKNYADKRPGVIMPLIKWGM
ncbi:ABC transporter ATP-binding protein [uncultured Polaribacter sp.]|uniref:ABC transporter ATP-binding protein n=1 Tax=uncultured Polaribacter sp. TaxID=174711 RepID=UPI002631DC33|nr:ABC transporter ATP-binding protein [uncultured Polaribacter sp.]